LKFGSPNFEVSVDRTLEFGVPKKKVRLPEFWFSVGRTSGFGCTKSGVRSSEIWSSVVLTSVFWPANFWFWFAELLLFCSGHVLIMVCRVLICTVSVLVLPAPRNQNL
jgi:hypothetical protein